MDSGLTQALNFYAGTHAYQHIQHHGLAPNDLRVIIGASGGPKWFVLSHLDRYLAGQWLPEIDHKIHLIGSSIGAWRMTAYANRNPLAALDRLEQGYLNQRYSDHADADEITAKVNEFIDDTLQDTAFDDLHPDRLLHLVTARCRGMTATHASRKQAWVFTAVAISNLFSRSTLPRYFDRVVFHSQNARLPLTDWDQFTTYQVPLQPNNLRHALQASGAIPVVIHGVTNPAGAPPGVYRDGGMVDYHFDLPIKPDNGLVLYPHFSGVIKPGWFDKPLPWRKVSADHYSHTLVVCPSQAFIDRLPYGKIPDRKDFEALDADSRIRYWNTVVDMNRELADEFHDRVSTGTLARHLKPISLIAR
jgi:hypothetical protein